MVCVIDDLLDRHTVAALYEAAAALPFEDGRRTAGRYARAVKANEQAEPTPNRQAILDKVREALDEHPLVRSLARPRAYPRLLVSRYTPGMAYGLHVDDAIMDGRRTDLSFTLCLSPSDAYEGGELVIDEALEERAIRLEAGQMVLYPSDTLHRVAPVTAGARLAVVGWITSWVPDAARRAILFDLDQAASALFAAAGPSPEFARLQRARSNLLRMWAEG
ncbi:MAG: Fe2+-dependent dioxygenase [Alphaproteobacteria bacterium]|nr:Fe2+-dependent dioxygenase [Alphaproteobacteria bacterium]MCB9929521.1 Fe2+-dependent dioxygenase [Alphaproteobacteria bacterium]